VGGLDFVVHAIGWADKAYLPAAMSIPARGVLTALDHLLYSFTAVARRRLGADAQGGVIC